MLPALWGRKYPWAKDLGYIANGGEVIWVALKLELKIGKLKIALAGYVESLLGVCFFVMYNIFCNFVVLYFNGVCILSCIVIYFELG